jgi:integrase
MYAKVRKREWTNKSGTHTAWIVDYKDQNGVRAIKTFTRKGEADEFMTTVRGEVRDKKHVIVSKSITVKEAGRDWITAVQQGRNIHGDQGSPAEASTIRQYEYHLKTYIEPALGGVMIAKLSKQDVQAFRNDLLKRISRPLARKVLTSLKGILSEAVDSERLVVNVASSVKIGSGGRHKEDVVIPSDTDIKAILAKMDELATQSNRRWADAWMMRRAFIATAIHTGFRASEIRGLPWSAVDLKAGAIKVVQRADENGVIGPLKSKAGYRTVFIPASLVAILKEWKMKAGKHALVFATDSEDGGPQSLPNIYNRAWKPIQLAAGVCDPKKDDNGNVVRDEEGSPVMEPRYNFHALRHYHASVLIADGADFKEIQTEMGHANIQITFDLYGHPIEGEDADKRRRERAERLASKLG